MPPWPIGKATELTNANDEFNATYQSSRSARQGDAIRSPKHRCATSVLSASQVDDAAKPLYSARPHFRRGA